jgi:hypothetical protein
MSTVARNDRDECSDEKHAQASRSMAPRQVDLRPIRLACFALLDKLRDLGENVEDEDAESRRIRLINTIEGTLSELRCDQNMIASL